jgi:hypothetical protein
MSRVSLFDLYPVKAGFSLANFARNTKATNEKSPWWRGRPIREFAVIDSSHGGREPGAWDNVKNSIEGSFSGARRCP